MFGRKPPNFLKSFFAEFLSDGYAKSNRSHILCCDSLRVAGKNVGVAGGATPTVSWGEDKRPERGRGGYAKVDYSRIMRKAAVLPAEVVAVSR